MAEGLIDTREVANNIADLSGIIKNKAYRGSVRGNISNITTNNLVVGTHGNIVEALNLASQSTHGRMSQEDKKKLDEIEAGSNKYIHPPTHSADMIVENAEKTFVSEEERAKWDKRITPVAETANNAKFLRNDNTWQLVTPGNIGAYTKEETYNKTEVDSKFNQLTSGLDWRATVNTFDDIATTYPNPQDGWTVNVRDTDYTYRYDGSKWIPISANSIPNATSEKDGKMSKEDKKKLDGIEENANNYKHPPNHSVDMIVENELKRFVTDVQIAAWNAKANRAGDTFTGNVVIKTSNPTMFNLYRTGTNLNNTIKFSLNDGAVNKYFGLYDQEFRIGDSEDLSLGAKVYHSKNSYVVPTPETANNAKFLRNDNTWQLVTPGNIGAYTKEEIDSKFSGWNIMQGVSAATDANFNLPAMWQNNRIYRLGTTQTGLGTSPNYGTVLVIRGGSDTGAQIQFPYSGNEIYFRNSNFGSTEITRTWNRIWHNGNFNPASYLALAGGTMTGALVCNSSITASSLIAKGGIEIYHGSTPYIDFHYANSTADYTSRIIESSSGVLNISGSLTVNSNITGAKVYNAVWNDYAELFPKLKSTITEAGDIIALDIENNKEVYTKATEETSSFIVGVHSDEYAHLIGGERPSDDYSGTFEEFNKDKFIPVGLAGRVKAKCIGIIKKGDKLVISDIPGVARAFNPKLDNINNVFGMAVENKNNPDVITRVRMFIKN